VISAHVITDVTSAHGTAKRNMVTSLQFSNYMS
jgi:hypothetical protein